MQRSGLSLAETVSPLRSDAMPHASILSSYIAPLCLGKSDFEAINGFREDTYVTEAQGVQQVSSEGIMHQRIIVPCSSRIQGKDSMIEAKKKEAGSRPRVLVFTTLFPSPAQPNAGVFIRERMFRVGGELPIKVVAPQPWFPFQGLLRLRKPSFRPPAPAHEIRDGVEVLRPRFFCVPSLFKSLDGVFLALSSYGTLRRLRKDFDFDVIDAHFGYPDGYAAVKLGEWFRRPVTITLRGTEPRHSRTPGVRRFLLRALQGADRIFSVSESLRQHALEMGAGPPEKIRVVGNGVDADKFFPLPKADSRRALGLPKEAKILITVGGLVERKGFHRVIALLQGLLMRHPDLRYLVVGGPSAEGDWSERLRAQVQKLGLDSVVSFLGALPHQEVKRALSAADVFVLATANEGWANVILEAMACGLPVIATDVGGNAEVVRDGSIGTIVPFGDPPALETALDQALTRDWDHSEIIGYAKSNSWDQRVETLVEEFRSLARANYGESQARPVDDESHE